MLFLFCFFALRQLAREKRCSWSNPTGTGRESRVSHTHTTSLGPVLAGLHFWDKLGMPKLLETLGFNELQRKTAAALVLNRLEDPVSEHTMPEWLAGSSLPDLLGDDLRRKAGDIFYRTGDRLLERRNRIEAHLRRRW